MTATVSGEVAVGVLGPVVLRSPDGGVLEVGSGRQRRLLAALALHAGAPVACDVLVDLVWGEEDLPADPDGALQTNVARLRRILPPAVTIGTGARTYRLDLVPGALDAARFTGHLAVAAAVPEPGRRLAELDAALALWRGRPYADLDHPAVAPEVARLDGLRAAAEEQRADALLAAGRAADAVAAAAALVTAEPLRETAVAILVRAMVAAGRPGEALRAYANLRAELAAQLGVDPSPQLQALHAQVLRHDPAVRTPAQVNGRDRPSAAGPPLPISSFVGREDDLARAMAVLADRRIVTLCGPGGVGKTRLARHVAAAVAGRYADGVVLVDLAGARPAALRLGAAGRAGLTTRIVEVLAVRRQLLVLDDCEHVLDAVAALVEAVALGAPAVDVLVTSREALRVDGEQVLPVNPLPPGPATALLADRLGAAGVTVPAEDGQRALVARICARLDGLPLALELAAARVPGIGLAGLLDALDAPLEVLRHGRRTAAPRHRSLRDVVAWSYGLLDEEQRTLFARLGVFGGAVEQAAVAAVCGPAAALPDLVERSLVVRHDSRYGMLDTLRAYARERLAATADPDDLRARHAAWVLDLVTDVHAARCRADEPAAVRRFDAHLAEVRRAHTWLCAHGPVEDLLRLGHVCAELGYQRARVDLVRLADAALRAAGSDPDGTGAGGGVGGGAADGGAALHPMLPRLLGLSAASRWQRGDLDGAERRCRRALALATRIGDPPAARDAFEALANVAMFRGDLGAAAGYGGRAAELARAAGDDPTLVMALCDLTIIAAYAGEDAVAARHERAATELAARMGSALARGWAAYAAGERRAEAGLPGAPAFLERAVVLAEEADGAFLAGVARHTLLTTAARAGDADAAPSRFGPLLDTWHGLGSWTQLWIAVRALAEALSRHGRHRDAAVLVGALRASRHATAEYGADSARVRAVLDAAAAALGPELAVAMAEGAALGDTEAVALARQLAGAGADREAGRPGGVRP